MVLWDGIALARAIHVKQTKKKHRDAMARLFPVGEPEKYEREPSWNHD